MNNAEFRALCSDCFKQHGFVKRKNRFIHQGQSDIFCVADLQRSDYSEAYYINCSFLTKSECVAAIEPYFLRRVKVKSVSIHNALGRRFLTDMLVIADYTPEQMQKFLNDAFDDWIMPTLRDGAEFVLKHKDKFIFPHIDPALTGLHQLFKQVDGYND